ncbi:hotdog domain-containing protein [Serpentinicella sp. ANB-PHB4]|uniref:acyl-CoA thioesterase n=1 Tax=Serpentinicella sp. ANB-PHB4 TaxID=3074076 RepID=UPI002858503C|nr:hotdog domain-containing protein [Serpentinicella sp. ANB-PHB4]MDR5659973.1 hotdog domain-containing protein [Serpentinicella sp. ANB-PHB4]
MTDNISFTKFETSTVMEPIHTNSMGNVHGGELMRLMDNVAGLAAYKHAKGAVVTARVDDIVFHKPVHIPSILTAVGQVIYVGTSSILVKNSMYVHDIKDYDNPELVFSAYVTFVHLKDNKPAKAPELVVKTKEEKALYQIGEQKYKEIKNKKQINK